MEWPRSTQQLIEAQEALAAKTPEPWSPPEGPPVIGACFVCFEQGESGPGSAADRGWAGAALMRNRRLVAEGAVDGQAGGTYSPGFLALREGRLLEAAVRALLEQPDVLLVNATGRDHPRRAGLAMHLGAILDLPSVGVTHRPLIATGEWPPLERSATAPLSVAEEVVGFWVCTRSDARPLAAHAGWRTDPLTAVQVLLAAGGRARTPEPMRQARRVAREARAAAGPVPPLAGADT
ncbi:MAG: endonuclease V [Acidimicrobiia bacterium]